MARSQTTTRDSLRAVLCATTQDTKGARRVCVCVCVLVITVLRPQFKRCVSQHRVWSSGHCAVPLLLRTQQPAPELASINIFCSLAEKTTCGAGKVTKPKHANTRREIYSLMFFLGERERGAKHFQNENQLAEKYLHVLQPNTGNLLGGGKPRKKKKRGIMRRGDPGRGNFRVFSRGWVRAPPQTKTSDEDDRRDEGRRLEAS